MKAKCAKLTNIAKSFFSALLILLGVASLKSCAQIENAVLFAASPVEVDSVSVDKVTDGLYKIKAGGPLPRWESSDPIIYLVADPVSAGAEIMQIRAIDSGSCSATVNSNGSSPWGASGNFEIPESVKRIVVFGSHGGGIARDIDRSQGSLPPVPVILDSLLITHKQRKRTRIPICSLSPR